MSPYYGTCLNHNPSPSRHLIKNGSGDVLCITMVTLRSCLQAHPCLPACVAAVCADDVWKLPLVLHLMKWVRKGPDVLNSLLFSMCSGCYEVTGFPTFSFILNEVFFIDLLLIGSICLFLDLNWYLSSYLGLLGVITSLLSGGLFLYTSCCWWRQGRETYSHYELQFPWIQRFTQHTLSHPVTSACDAVSEEIGPK